MLARANRLTRADDYRSTVRRGRRTATGHTVVYVVRRSDEAEPRFGFIVSKAVGNAVTRNVVRRRLKAVCYSLVTRVPSSDVVIRALPGAAGSSWAELRDEVTSVILAAGSTSATARREVQ